LHPHVNITIA